MQDIAAQTVNILIVDDEPDNLVTLTEILNEVRYVVRIATNGAAALEDARLTQPDLILLDILMPKMDGFEVCAAFKADEQLRNVPVIFLSALGAAEDKVKAFAAGGVDYITKPFQVQEVRARIHTHLTLRNAQRLLALQNARLQQEIVDRERAEEALRVSEARYRSLFEDAAIPLWEQDLSAIKHYTDQLCASKVTDFRHYFREYPEAVRQCAALIRTRDLNAAAVEFYGADSKRQLLANLQELFCDESLPGLVEGFVSIAEGARVCQHDAVNRTLTGDIRHLIVRWVVVPGYKVTYGRVIVSSLDISEHKRLETQLKTALQEKDILLQEVHHRVKNNLQTIASLLRLRSDDSANGPCAEIFRDLHHKLHSMTLIHEMLYQTGDLSSIDFGDYVRELVAELFHSFEFYNGKVRPQIDVDQVLLNLNTAIPCGLLINELLTNALKYAFPGNRHGEVIVSLHPSECDWYELVISDTGIGLPDNVVPGATDSLGFTLVAGWIDQLRADLEIDRTAGTRFRIRFREL